MHDPKDPKARPLEPPEEFDYKGDFGLYKSKYDKKNSIYIKKYYRMLFYIAFKI